MFVQDPFDIAPRARRFTAAAWAALAVSVLMFGAAAALLARGWMDAAVASTKMTDVRSELQALTQRKAMQAAEASRKPSEETRARLELQRILNVSWTGLFEVLESATKAVDGRVVIAALAPTRLRPDGAELSLTALASDTDQMLQYLQAVQSDRRVKQLQFVSQEKAAVNGSPVIRFQATLLLDRPSGSLASPRGKTTQAMLGIAE